MNAFNYYLILCLAGVTLFSGPRVNGSVNFSKANTLHHEYNSKACTIEIVNNVDEAIEHIHTYGRYVKSFQ